ncbi:MAG: glycosyltransferase family 2 protein, partial [candidate division KSB1 bacterium]|nr:glycosyltransferase family 2 protein [candidate division KSB1 bacterium]
VNGSVAKIEQPILHYTYPTIRSHIDRMNRYTELGLIKLMAQHRSSSLFGAVARGVVKFIKMYFLQQGFRDGRIGFVLCYNSAFGVYLKYLKLWENQR